MRVGIFAKTFPGETPLQVLTAARTCGYASVQYNFACSGIGALPETIPEPVVEAIKSASAQTGVTIAAISATYNMIHPDLATREKGRASFAAIAAVARSIGSNLLTVCTGSRDATDQWRDHPENQSAEAWSEMIAEFRHLVEIAERHDIYIGVEPELANVINSAHKARVLLDTVKTDRIRIVFDPANLFEVADDDARAKIIDEAVHLLEDRIAIAHAKDRNADGSFATAGKGVIDYLRYIASLKSAGFQGDLITHGLGAAEAQDVATFLKAALGQKALA
ncbi:sugar phosphate isomerase/epimerase [Rhizobium rhizogenes]|uniref:Sugar phosphate isomerase/epimerase n=1 Tax=Rhizobium rhizogenes TaxID=359 RepID=A0AA92C028_RHIRH|nr:sugar phosphate isomerase/epimerase [Rhizobium rhizogenes]PVE50610.1 sugar phosphate isomerase/epimerase [Rhizobium rhizogenes]PVE62389.1 sugar phosphate isomerase/epimerase [Agrobacterium tumefaciens]PVE70572.1 sugar phosphate isomerase/epimerase [Sphingomonas sp. TPD3009]